MKFERKFVVFAVVLIIIMGVFFQYIYSLIDNIKHKEEAKSAKIIKDTMKISDDIKTINEKIKSQLDSLMQDNKVLDEKNKKLQGEKEYLEKSIQILQAEKDERKNKINAFSLDTDTLDEMKGKIKAASIKIDELNISSYQKKTYDSLIHSIYKELSSLDYNMAKLAKDEPLYQDKFFKIQNELKEKIKEWQNIKDKLTAIEGEIKGYKEKARVLEADNSRYIKIIKEKENLLRDYQNNIDKISKEKGNAAIELSRQKKIGKDLARQLENLREERKKWLIYKDDIAKQIIEDAKTIKLLKNDVDKLNNRIESLDSEKEKLLSYADNIKLEKDAVSRQKSELESIINQLKDEGSRKNEKITFLGGKLALIKKDYEENISKNNLLEKRIEEMRLASAERADKILTIQEDLEEKNDELLKLRKTMENQLKDLVNLRETAVRLELKNAYLFYKLKKKDTSLSSLKEEIKNIGEINTQFKKTLERASGILDKSKKLQAPIQSKDDVIKENEDKEVEIKIKGIEPKESVGK